MTSPFRNAKGEPYAAPILVKNGADVDGISERARGMLDGILSTPGIPEVRVNSGFRDPSRNAAAGGAKKSQHINGNAIDLDISGFSDDQKRAVLSAAIKSGARGIGIYPSGNSLHIDVRETPTFWGTVPGNAYAGASYKTAPEWARGELTALWDSVPYPRPLGVAPGDVQRVTPDPQTGKVSWTAPISSTQPYTDTERNQQAAQAEAARNPFGLGELAKESLWDGQTINWLMAGRTDLLPDPNWNPSADTFKAAREGIPEQYWGALDGAESQAQLDQKRRRLLDDMEREKRFADNGWTGTAFRFAGAFLDVPGLALTALAPELGVPAKAAMLSRIGIAAAEGAAINAALEVPRVMNKPTAQGSDLLWAAGTGMALGGAFGAIARNPAVAEEARRIEMVGKSLVKQAEEEAREELLGSTALSGGKSVGAAQASPRETLTLGAEDWLHKATDDAIDRSAFSSIRWDDAGRGKASDNAATRAFTSGTVVDVVGNKDRSKVVGITAEEVQKMVHSDMTLPALKLHRDALADYATRNPELKGDALDAAFSREVTQALDNVMPVADIDPAVARVVALQDKIYAGYLELAQNPGLTVGGTRRAVKGFENVEKGRYRPNIPDHEKIDLHSIRYGDDTMRSAIASAFKAKLPEITDALAAKMAKGYWRTLRETTAGMSNLDRALHGDDLERLKEALEDIGLDAKEISVISAIVRPKPSEGQTTTHAKRRAPYDNSFTVKLRATDGTIDTFRMADLFRDNYLENLMSYSRTMSGNIAMATVRVKNPLWHATENPEAAEWLIDGITGKGDFDKLSQDMRAVWDAKTELPFDKRKASADRDAARMQFIYDRIIGIPDKFDATKTGRFLRAVRDYNFTRVMNQVGLAQVGEMMGVTTQFGLKAAMDGMPSFRAFMRDARTGELKDEFAREIEQLSGFGVDFFRDGFRHFEDGAGTVINRSTQGKAFNKAEDILHSGKRITNVVSGMAAVDTFSRRWAAGAAAMKIVNAAMDTGRKASHLLNMDRMRALGIDEPMAERIFRQIRKHSSKEAVEGSGKRSYAAGNFDRWDDKEAFAHFRTAVWRWSRLAIQENFQGQSNRFLGHWTGRTIFQFRTFMLGAHTTQLLRNLHIRDFSGFSTWLLTSLTGAMVYAAQTHLNSIGRSDRKEFLEERLSLGALGRAAFQRGSWSALMPTVFDTALDAAGFDPLFNTRASGTGSSFLDNPSLDLVRTGLKASGGLGRAAREGGYAQTEARALMRIMPFQNMLPIIPLLNAMIGDRPEHVAGAH
ncbi:MAG: DUF882 domain-containing protein [Rhizobiales bacterium]|nr:DUF882 domain-containing protein [Hyphomicrobiales bacterium]